MRYPFDIKELVGYWEYGQDVAFEIRMYHSGRYYQYIAYPTLRGLGDVVWKESTLSSILIRAIYEAL